ncbi:MAG: T9SS type A sorting domain-containing protein, partial [Rhodothermales bacterium]|nr:T9SS type A sorting domain-containing protein [Rhodothermales bacterium]
EGYPIDILDRPRIRGSSVDAGAFEHVAEDPVDRITTGQRFAADLSVEKTVETLSDSLYQFQIVVTNGGPGNTGNVEIRDNLPPELETVLIEPSQGFIEDTFLNWFVGPVAVGESDTLTITVRATSVGSFINEACVAYSSMPDPDDSYGDDSWEPERNDCSTAELVVTNVASVPNTVFGVHSNFPNPFAERTTIEFEMESPGIVSVGIYDMLGRLLFTSPSKPMRSGINQINVDGTELPAGLYFYKLSTGNKSSTGRMVVLR